MSGIDTPGIIRADESYTLAEFRKRTQLQQYALTQARRAGLRVVKCGKKRFVLGADWLKFLERQAATEP